MKPLSALFVLSLLCAMLSLPQVVRADSTWTLDRCIQYAVENAPRLKANMKTAESAFAAAQESNANRWPTLGVTGTYSYSSETQKIEFEMPPIPGFTAPKMEFGDGNTYDFALAARIPVYSGGALREKSLADRYASQAVQWDARQDSLRLRYDVRRAYFNALGSEARADAARQSAGRLNRHLDELNGAKSIGTVSEESRIAALARLRQAEQAVLSAEAELRGARLALGNLLALPDVEIVPDGNVHIAVADSSLAPVEDDSRADIRAIQTRIEQNRHLTRGARGSLLPSLSGTAMYHYGKPGVNAIENEWMDYYTLGLSASWTIWDWKARTSKVRQARAAMNTLIDRKTELENSIRTRIGAAIILRRASAAAYGKAAERANLERKRLTMVEGRLRKGMASESEFLDAQDDLTAAETDLVSAATRLRIAETDLLYAAGY